MRLPRDLSGTDLAKSLARLGYRETRQTGSHVRLTTEQGGQHHVTIPAHDVLKVGTLNAALREVAEHFQLPRDEVLEILFT